jgi:membrane-associated phospholipid phosphatase
VTAVRTPRTIVFRCPPQSREAAFRMGLGALVLAGVGVVLGEVVDSLSPIGIEERALAGIAEERSPGVTAAFTAATRLWDLWVVALAMAVTVPLLRRATGRWEGSILLVTALVGSLVVTAVIKVVVGRARPIDALLATDSAAFPSGHTSRAAAVLGLGVWLVVVLARRPAVRAALATALGASALVIAFSRIYLGVHWPTDVAYGLAVGVGWLLVMLTAIGPHVAPAEAVPPDEPQIPNPLVAARQRGAG